MIEASNVSGSFYCPLHLPPNQILQLPLKDPLEDLFSHVVVLCLRFIFVPLPSHQQLILGRSWCLCVDVSVSSWHRTPVFQIAYVSHVSYPLYRLSHFSWNTLWWLHFKPKLMKEQFWEKGSFFFFNFSQTSIWKQLQKPWEQTGFYFSIAHRPVLSSSRQPPCKSQACVLCGHR